MITAYSSDDFLTNCEPAVQITELSLQYEFHTLLARHETHFQFVDYLFESKTSDLHGAVGTIMRPVGVDEAQRKVEKYKDPNSSPVWYLYEKGISSVSWEDWIDSFLGDDYSPIFDQSYAEKYGSTVIEYTLKNPHVGLSEVYLVECVGGGRMSNRLDRDDYDEVYDHELFRLAKQAEKNGLGGLYKDLS